jgi:hypothetical protein
VGYTLTHIISFTYVNSVFRREVSQKCAVLGSRNNAKERSSHLLTFQQDVLLSSSGQGGMKRMKLTVTHILLIRDTQIHSNTFKCDIPVVFYV